jgi:hypothetical protein
MSISAGHAGRRVELAVTVRSTYDGPHRCLTVRFSITPGESLDRLAREVRTLFAQL